MTPITHTKGPFEQGTALPNGSRYYQSIWDGRGNCLGVVYGPVSHVWGDVERGTSLLFSLAPTAPHDCDDPTCPGAVNKRKLEAFEGLMEATKNLTFQCSGIKQMKHVEPDLFDQAVLNAEEAISEAEGRTT